MRTADLPWSKRSLNMDFAALYNRGPSASLRDFVVDISVVGGVSVGGVSVSVGGVVYLVGKCECESEYGVSRLED